MFQENDGIPWHRIRFDKFQRKCPLFREKAIFTYSLVLNMDTIEKQPS